MSAAAREASARGTFDQSSQIEREKFCVWFQGGKTFSIYLANFYDARICSSFFFWILCSIFLRQGRKFQRSTTWKKLDERKPPPPPLFLLNTYYIYIYIPLLLKVQCLRLFFNLKENGLTLKKKHVTHVQVDLHNRSFWPSFFFLFFLHFLTCWFKRPLMN